MKRIHKDLSDNKWFKMSFAEQMANIGSEVHRTITWKKKNRKFSELAFERSLELFDLTIKDLKNRSRLKEIMRAKELWVDYIFGDNEYHQNDKIWQNYFYGFNYFAANLRGL